MEEKERYELFGEHCIKDNNPDARCQLLNTYQVYVILNEKDKENQQLKQQLAEKDEKIAYLTKQVKKFNNEAQKYFEDAYCNDFQKQTKIDFAVERLEKVKWWCQGNAIQCFYNEAETEIKEKHIVVDRPQENGSPSLIKYIDNQIKQLKELK